MTDPFSRLFALASCVAADEHDRGLLSSGERLAVALALNRADWLAEEKYTIAEAIDRIGPEWCARLLSVQIALAENGWMR